MKCKTKTFLTLLLAVSILICTPGMTVFATQRTDLSSYESGSIAGSSVSGSVVTGTDSATANTVFSLPGGRRGVSATVYYLWNGTLCTMSGSNSSSQSGGVSVTAKVSSEHPGGSVIGGKGLHSVAYEQYTWTKETGTGYYEY